MRIESIRVRNYRSFLDSGEIQFSPNWHLIVGANNVGKSSLLDCLSGRFKATPHRSLRTRPTPDEPLDPVSSVAMTLVASGDEVRKLLLSMGGQRHLPWPRRVRRVPEHSEMVLQKMLAAPEIRFRISAYTTGAEVNWNLDEYPATRLDEPLVEGATTYMLQFSVAADRRALNVEGVGSAAPTADSGIPIGRELASRIYRFNAERFNFGQCPFGTRTELQPDASNLAEVLNALQGTRERFRIYCELVREVFPAIQAVSVRPQGGANVEILIWQLDPATNRDDLATPLAQSGTGVAQALAILYVAQTSTNPRTILIDEPGSFLHPGASRALIRILKRSRLHQYIIATHSPEVLAELADAPVSIIRWSDSASTVEQHARTTGSVAAAALQEVGARLSDVFGFDYVLWVEGPSDADALKLLLELRGTPQRHLAILPVRDTGAFKRRSITEVLDIYRRLAMGEALLPPAALFVFDRDGRSETEIADAAREGGGKLRFWDRRMFENYLLHPTSIARLFNEAGAEHGIETTEGAVRECLRRKGHELEYLLSEPPPEPFTPAWLAAVHGAKLLQDLFVELSDAQLEYRKVTDTPRLTALVCEADAESLTDIIVLIADVLERPLPG